LPRNSPNVPKPAIEVLRFYNHLFNRVKRGPAGAGRRPGISAKQVFGADAPVRSHHQLMSAAQHDAP
jgi:hypothetical protein